jgi:hypothetical protein
MMTTDSDRAFALKKVQQLRAGAAKGQGAMRYNNLASFAEVGLGGGNTAAALAGAGHEFTNMRSPVVHKQVDRDWLNRKMYGGPSPHDLHSLYAPDPLVALRVDGSGGGSSGTSSDQSALQFAKEDESQKALSRFVAPVSADQLLRHCQAVELNPLQAETAAASGPRELFARRDTDHLVHLTSAPMVL